MQNEHLADTVIYTVGSLAEWLVDNTDFINTLLPLVIPGLEVSFSLLIFIFNAKNIEDGIGIDFCADAEANNTWVSLLSFQLNFIAIGGCNAPESS